MKWATPVSAGVSSRDPARTYAAMETERAPGIREVMTRGPSGSAVRSNIAGDGTGELPPADLAGQTDRRIGQTEALMIGSSQSFRKNTTNAIAAPHISGWISPILPRTSLMNTQAMTPAPMPMAMS